MRVAYGPQFNLVGVDPSTLVVSPAAHASFPLANLYDGLPINAFKFGTWQLPCTITKDVDRIQGTGSFETGWVGGAGGTPPGWSNASAGTGGTTQVATSAGGDGSFACQFNSGSGTAYIYRYFIARSGERLRLTVALAGNGVNSIKLRVGNSITGNYLTSAGTWQTGATYCATRAVGTYATTVIDFTVESFVLTGYENVTIGIELVHDTSGVPAVYCDALQILPAVNFAMIGGHDYPGLVTWEVYSGATNPPGTLRATLDKARRPLMWSLFSDVYARYWQFKLSGNHFLMTPAILPYIGEAVLCDMRPLACTIDGEVAGPIIDPSVRGDVGHGSFAFSTAFKFGEQHAKAFIVAASTPAERAEVLEIIRKSRGGRTAIVLPDHLAPAAYMGRFAASYDDTWLRQGPAGEFSRVAFQITDHPQPVNMF